MADKEDTTRIRLHTNTGDGEEDNTPNNSTTNVEENTTPTIDFANAPSSKDDDGDKVIQNENAIPFDEGKTHPRILAIMAVIAGILVITAGYVVYKYFNQVRPIEPTNIAGVEVQEESPREKADSSGIITQDNTSDDSFGIITPESAKDEKIAGVVTKKLESKAPSKTWVANDYKKGDISRGKYTVLSGDTLWEIAEAVYGNGAQWHKIADANNVSYLSNGHPLIIPGQVLTIP